jgi:hypothetical protein
MLTQELPLKHHQNTFLQKENLMMKLGNCLASAAGIAFLAGSMVVCGSTPPAHANGGGCTVYSTIPYIDVPSGTLCFDVLGQGTNIDKMEAKWLAPSLANWRIDWVIYYQGKTWWRDNGPAHNSSDHVQGGRTRGSGKAPAGSEICAELYNTSRNIKIDAACASISN